MRDQALEPCEKFISEDRKSTRLNSSHPSFPTRRSSDLRRRARARPRAGHRATKRGARADRSRPRPPTTRRSTQQLSFSYDYLELDAASIGHCPCAIKPWNRAKSSFRKIGRAHV